MSYIKVQTVINPFKEWIADILIADYANVGFESFESNSNGFDAYIPTKMFNKDYLYQIHKNYSDFDIDFTESLIEEQNWNKVWEENYFQPLFISDDCVVRAPFHQPFPEVKHQIIIEPNMAFGTGNHETTMLMMHAILQNSMTNKSILDMGCGTGILSILSSMRGAKTITAVDIDQWAYNATQENSKINNIKNIKVIHGDVKEVKNKHFDIIFANIHKNIIISDLQYYSKCLNDDGVLLVSGFYENDLKDVLAEAEKYQLRFLEKWVRNDWTVAKLQYHE